MADGPGTDTLAGAVVRRLVADPRHGPLPALLLVMTVLTGVVDAVSILSLGHVFVANMTGNIVFIAFGLAGAEGFVLGASLSALGGFVLGAIAGGAVMDRVGAHRGHVLLVVATGELVLLAVALIMAAVTGASPDAGAREGIAAVIAFAMGAQNTAVRRLKVLDMLTTVLTTTLIGVVAVHDEDRAGRVRRVSVIVSMFLGAVAGALLVLQVSTTAALGLAVALLAVVVVVTARASRQPAPWHQPPA